MTFFMLCNGGGIRNEIAVGDVTRKMLMDINPWSNAMCVVEITGQQLLDVLEHGARSCPESLGGFFQVSGVTFEIHTHRESPVITDMNGNFEGIDETMERRVENVLVDGEPVDLEYTEGTDSTCIEHGYTAGLYCPDCDEYTWGHEEKELSELHWDSDENMICDDCGSEIVYEECEHFCHNDHWFVKFIWKIVQFFCSIFNIEPVCECGEAHY